ncbi:hypothetical protein PVAG01_10806 [Phlyctema vagabunda]|uniref:Transmembrane protein n=1 Tax=Phlyctema vagabunda TaxID=108571 RepID=A0ABR4P3A2_9HELO
MAPIKMAPFKTSYLVPAILLNPAFVLHLFNTFVSHLLPPPCTASVSPHPFMENLGPLPGTKIAIDVHENDPLCWGYTVIMVIVQCLAFGSVQDNRVKRRSARAAKLERSKRLEQERDLAKEKSEVRLSNDAQSSHKDLNTSCDGTVEDQNRQPNGHVIEVGLEERPRTGTTPETENESDETTETSEEEMML